MCVLIIEVQATGCDITKGHARSGQGSLGSCCSLNCALYDASTLAQPSACVGRGWSGLAPCVMCQHLARTGRPGKLIPFSEGDFPIHDLQNWVITPQRGGEKSSSGEVSCEWEGTGWGVVDD
ncbi:hypothetical protein E2C01_011208 [Portunus trituberculatus]|uniref:Uncharacterized protein n=1 Tax=Portunus trituberculatus TaxID=210409 RepID=A0A5B7DAT8_PORTR|nr:hypothetical protein [Portunus trituberculatus]